MKDKIILWYISINVHKCSFRLKTDTIIDYLLSYLIFIFVTTAATVDRHPKIATAHAVVEKFNIRTHNRNSGSEDMTTRSITALYYLLILKDSLTFYYHCDATLCKLWRLKLLSIKVMRLIYLKLELTIQVFGTDTHLDISRNDINVWLHTNHSIEFFSSLTFLVDSGITFHDWFMRLCNNRERALFIEMCSLHTIFYDYSQWNFFAVECKIMQHYVIHLYKIMQHNIIRGDISPHIRRLIVVNDRFCGDGCP